MTELTAKFSLVDDMSNRFADLAERGQNMVAQWERMGDTANMAFDGLSDGVVSTVSAVSGVAVSIEDARNQLDAMGNGWEKELDAANRARVGIDEVTTSADTLSDTMDSYEDAAEAAAMQTEHWTSAVGNYDKGMLEAVYSTKELVEMGLKSAAALEEQERMLELCGQSAGSLSRSIEATVGIHDELEAAITKAAGAVEQQNYAEGVSVETKDALSAATMDALSAMHELTAAQEEAAASMEAYDSVMASGTTDLDTLEAAAERAGHAAEALAEANSKASNATEELSRATEKASAEAENSGKKGTEIVEALSSALAAAGITATIKDISEAVYGLANAFSEAESTVVLATGATGDTLDGLTASMMEAYAASRTGNLDETAAAVGEINTRLAFTGDELTETTGLFLDFAAATGGDAASSVRSVTQLMNQWNVPATEMKSVLDRLTYAGQASGISVDTLSQQLTTNKAILDQLGFSLNEATAMFMNFELAGTNTTAVMTGFRTALSSGAIGSLEELYDVFDQISSGAMTAADASEMFGSRAGPAIVNAVNSGVLSLDDMVASLEAADGTLATTAEAAQTLDQKWAQANNNIGTAFTTAVQPALDGFSSGLADIMNGVGDFLNEHQTFTKIITAAGIGIGVVAVGITGVAFASKVAIPAVTAFGTAFNEALGPIGWVALGITAVVTAGTALVAILSDANDETAGMTATTQAQYYKLQNLNAEYERACQESGEYSDEALELKYQVDNLSEAFEANRQTVEEFTAEVDALCESTLQLSDDFNSALTEINSQETGALALIQRYEELATQAERTGAQQEELEAITKKLSESYPELTGQFDNATMSAEEYVEAMERACEQQAEQLRQQQAQETFAEALQKQADLTKELEKAQANYNAELASHNMVWDESMQAFTNGAFTADSPLASWTTDLDEYSDALEELKAAEAENEAVLAEIRQEWEAAARAVDDAITLNNDFEVAAASAYDSVRANIEALCAAYDEAYEAALDSFEGQFGLFDEASTNSEEYLNSTVANAQAALDSQLAYWESYNANLETLTAYGEGLTGEARENYNALLAYAQSGSEEAAGLANSIAEAIASGDEQAVTDLANTISKISAQQEAAAAATADWQTNFTAEMDKYEQEMKEAIEHMDMSEEAKASATTTVNGYAEAIRANKGNAVNAAQEVANAVEAALSSVSPTIRVNVATSGSVPGHARGTTNAESVFLAGEEGPELVARPAVTYATGTTDSADYFIAGENGPELIVGAQGSTVFPTGETDRLIAALSEQRRPLQVFADAGGASAPTPNADSQAEQSRNVFVHIDGSGPIEVTGSGANKEAMLEVLTNHLKPVLLGIIQGEIFEEGDLSYDY